MIRILHLADPAQRSEAQELRASAAMPEGVAATVADIIADVRERGDVAVRELTARFDDAQLRSLFLDDTRWDALAAECPAPVRAALQLARSFPTEACCSASRCRCSARPATCRAGARPIRRR